MKLKFTEVPIQISQSVYEEALNFMSNKLMSTGLVKGVYQVGGVSAPGISDLDIYVVFKNGTSYKENPVKNLKFPYNYLFSHRLFGTSESLIADMEKFTFFGNYNLLAGEISDFNSYTINEQDKQLLKSQIAIEYLIKAWYAISMSITFKNIKIRSFLLNAKAVEYDMKFLNIEFNSLKLCIQEIIDIRKSYFENKTSDVETIKLIEIYRHELELYLQLAIKKCNFYLPIECNHRIGKNVSIGNDARLNFTSNGIIFPEYISSTSKLIQKLNNRLINFKIGLPITHENIPSIIQQRFKVLSSAFKFNNSNYPNFICTGHGLNIFNNH